jgi:hypothetical protein
MTDPGTGSGPSETGKGPPNVLQFAGLGLMNALCWIGGLAGGWFLDSALGTLPVFMFVGLVLGIGLGFFASRAELRRFF